MKNKIEISNIIMIAIVNFLIITLIIAIFGDMNSQSEDETEIPSYEYEQEVPVTLPVTPESEPKPEPTSPTNTASETGTINGDGVNIRQNPSLDSLVVDQVWGSVEVTILDYDYNEEWIQISFDGNPAYVWREFIDVE